MNAKHISLQRPQTRLSVLPALIVLALGGCATPEYVHKEVGQYDQRIVALESWFNTITTGLDTQAKRLREAEARLDHMAQTGSSLGTRLDATEALLRGTGEHVDRLAAELASANQRIDASKADAARTVQHLAGLDNQLAATSRRLDGAMTGLATAEGSIGELETRLLQAKLSSEAARIDTEAKSSPSPDAVSPVASSRPDTAQHQSGAPVPQPVLPDSASRADVPSQPAGPAQPIESASADNALLAEVGRKVEAHSGALSAADSRLAALESGLAATVQRSQVQDALLHATDQKVGALQTELAFVRQKVNANIEAITLVDNRVGEVNAGLDEAHKRVEEGEKVLAESGLRLTMVQEMIKGQSERLSRTELENDKVSSTALEALERAREAGKLAEGKLLSETILSDEITNFGFKEAKLNDLAKQRLNDFANKLKAENKGVYIEIQGHTDSLGTTAINLRLSRERAQAVRDYLNQEAGIPLHRLAVAAYGESKPVADNKTKEGRSRNRRVVLVVLE